VNYRKKTHAGGFADVLKHATLTRIVSHLRDNDTAFRVVDTHAGAGLYDLSSPEVQKTGAWRDGIERLIFSTISDPMLAPYLDVVRNLNPAGRIVCYPGSPKLVHALLRPRDRLLAIELQSDEADELKALFDGDYQTRIVRLDGWLALGTLLLPQERRSLVLVDPPFEHEGEYDRLVDGLARAYRRWQGCIYCLSYPIRAGAPIADFHTKLGALGIPGILCAELRVWGEEESSDLSGSGVILVNPPPPLEAEMKRILPILQKALARSKQARHALIWLSGKN